MSTNATSFPSIQSIRVKYSSNSLCVAPLLYNKIDNARKTFPHRPLCQLICFIADNVLKFANANNLHGVKKIKQGTRSSLALWLNFKKEAYLH